MQFNNFFQTVKKDQCKSSVSIKIELDGFRKYNSEK